MACPRWWLCLLLLGLAGGLTVAPVDLIVSAAVAQAPAAVQRGYELLNKGWVDAAIAAFEQALLLSPQSSEARLGLAIAYQRAGRDADAWAAYNQVLGSDPNNQTALKAVGEMGVYRSEWQPRGIEALTTLLELTPNDLETRAQRALLLGYQGRFTESLADYEIVLQSNPTPEMILGAAQIYTFSGDYQTGLKLFNRYQATGSSVPNNALGAYAVALRETGNPAEAIQILSDQLSQSQKLDGTEIQLRSDLAQAYQANGQLARALEVLEPLRGREDATLALARALSSIGRRERRTDLYREAATLYRQVLASAENPSLALQREVADVLSELPSERAAALEIYRQLTQQQPNNRSLLVKQLALEGQLGFISRAELRQRLFSVLQPLPSTLAEQRSLAQALVPLDPPDPELFPVYQSLLTNGVDVPFLNFRIAQMLIQRNQLEEAKQAISAYRATPEGSNDLTPELLLAEIDRREGNLGASAARYEGIIQQNPSNELLNSALRGLAGIRIAQGRPDEAIAIYDQLLQRNPNDLVIKLGRTSLAYQTKRISASSAEAVLDEWLQTRPSTDLPPELFSLVGALPPSPEREELYLALLEVDPDNTPVQLRRLQVIAERDPELAKAEVEELIARNPENLSAYFVQGELAFSLNDLDLANQAYQEILAREPDNIGALMALGGVRFTQQLYISARKFYERVLEISPGYLEARRNLAELSVAQDFRFQALAEFRELNAEQEAQAGESNPELERRIQLLEVDILKRRGFQPYWERY
ncbi:MAG: tetratricopeptide repeat protein [Symploca sp. SIO1A3]|nr:tetratricopeptide repeat protein [Symploca sp. SIO1A3]